MTNPRKFSEKIALHNQKQAEETAAFEQIMSEVMAATVKPTPPQPVKQTHLLPLLGAFRGGSLPNVNQMSQQGDKGNSSGRMLYNNNQSVSPRSSRNVLGPVRTKHRTDHSPYASPPMSHSMSSNPVNIDLPGLSFGCNYLSPPPEPNWRRANSDSALNSINNSLLIPSVVPDSSEESSNNSNDPRDTYGLGVVGKNQDSPNAGCDGPTLLEIPQSLSTGSLPDLTNFQFPPPLQQPIDMDESQHNQSPYSNSPLTGSSLTYSPSMSPHPPSGMGNHHPSQQPLNHSSAQQQQQSPVQRPQQQRQQQQQQHHSQSQQHSPQSLIDIPLHVNTSFQNFSPNDNNMLSTYRCPQRPSPQNSPLPFRSASPLEGHLSAPPSPTNQPTQQTSADSYFLSQQAQALQQHFEQISMVDTLPQRNNGHWQGGGMVNSATYFYNAVPNPGATAGVTTQQSPQHPQPQTPQTPSSIPDIIFTEFLGADFSDVGRAGDPVEEFLASEAAAVALREGLGPIDLDGLEMLRDPSLVQLDSNAEDSFRLDRQ